MESKESRGKAWVLNECTWHQQKHILFIHPPLQLARLEEVGEQVASGKQAKAELTAQLDIAQGEVLLLRQHLEDQAQHMAGLEGQLEEKK